MLLIFWGAIALIGYSYLLYPALLGLLARFARARREPATEPGMIEPPAVACIIAAYNEQWHIEARIENLLKQTYRQDKLRIYVGCDGSKDRTAELIEAYHDDRVSAFAFEHNRGKASVLNDLVAAAEAPILVFTDANTLFHADAIERLVGRFADPRVGVVCGELKLLASKGNNQDNLYWRVEQFLKRSEAEIGGLLGANGAIYALRRELYQPLAADTITDDFCIAMTAAADGWKLVYEPSAIAVEDTPHEITEEYRRRVRIGVGNYQALFRHPEYMLRTNWATRFSYASHKVLRWLTPHLMVAALISSAVLALSSTLYLALFCLQLLGYGFGAHLLLRRRVKPMPGLAAAFAFFLALNWAFLVAFVRFLTGRYGGSWRSTAREVPAPASTT